MEILFCPKTKSPKLIKNDELYKRYSRVLIQLMSLTMLYSILQPRQFQYFDTTLPPDSVHHALKDLISLPHIGNNLLAAMLVYLVLSFGSDLMAVGINSITGYETILLMNDPLTLSTSPSDFWGRRWNMVIHNLLKRGVFQPVKRFYGRTIASLSTFIMSGLMHEYAWSIIFYSRNSTDFYPKYGKNMIFFAWNGLVILLERQIGHWHVFQWIKCNLPRPMITFLVIMTSIPISHLFSGDWIIGGYFQDFVIGVPMFVMM